MISQSGKDVSFDALHKRFNRNVYQTGKGKLRLELTKAEMLRAVPALQAGKSLNILDAGAGMGQISLWLAEMGHRVTLADISKEMLQRAGQQLEKAKLQDQVKIIQAPIQALPQLLAGQSFDLVVLHGVIAWMESPLEAVSCLLPLLKTSGCMSLLYFNKDKLILKWGIAGQVASAAAGSGRRKGSLTPINPVSYAEIESFCRQNGIEIIAKAGIRVFYRFFLKFPEKYNCDLEEFFKLELQYNRTEPYASLGEHTHLVLRLS